MSVQVTEQEETSPPLEVRNRIKGLVEVESAAVFDHPHQWRVHPKSQIKTLQAALEHVGQANVIIVYRCVNDLTDAKGNIIPAGSLVAIDGHNRKNKSGVARWQAVELDVDDEEAAFLLATLDPISAMATTDKDAWARLYDSLPVAAAPVQMMMDGILGYRMPEKSLSFKAGGLADDEESEPNSEAVKVPSIPVSTVRMVQLYLDNESHPRLMTMADTLGDAFGTVSLTDTVMRAVEYAYNATAATSSEQGETVKGAHVAPQAPPHDTVSGAEVSPSGMATVQVYMCAACDWTASPADFSGVVCPDCGTPVVLEEVTL
jgi:DNA-directed RNA polymerase subunit RPC12/RpoP